LCSFSAPVIVCHVSVKILLLNVDNVRSNEHFDQLNKKDRRRLNESDFRKAVDRNRNRKDGTGKMSTHGLEPLVLQRVFVGDQVFRRAAGGMGYSRTLPSDEGTVTCYRV